MSCRTCELLRDLRQVHRETNKDLKARGDPARKNKFTAAIIDRTYRGRVTYYTAGSYNRRIPLNYCPECGRQIKTKRRGKL